MRVIVCVLMMMLLAGLGVAADDEALPAGALTKVVKLMEWALGSPLSEAERMQVQETQTAAWRANEGPARANLRMLVQVYDLVQTMPADQKEKIREQMRASMGQTLRQPGMPAELVGEWSSMHTSSVQFTNPNTGSWAPPSGNGMQFKFFADGRFQSASLIQSSLYNCTMTINAFEEGVIEIRGGQFTFKSKGGTLDSKDTCSASSNYKKTLPANDQTYNWRMDRDQWGAKFCIVRAGIREECLYRKKE